MVTFSRGDMAKNATSLTGGSAPERLKLDGTPSSSGRDNTRSASAKTSGSAPAPSQQFDYAEKVRAIRADGGSKATLQALKWGGGLSVLPQ